MSFDASRCQTVNLVVNGCDGSTRFSYWVSVGLGEILGDACNDEPLVFNAASGQTLSWVVASPGYRAQDGRVTLPASPTVEPSRIECSLVPGWGALVEVVDLDRRPVEGVAIVLDGRIEGVTNDAGISLVGTARAPEILTVDEQWTIERGDVNASGQILDSGHGRLTLVVSRAP